MDTVAGLAQEAERTGHHELDVVGVSRDRDGCWFSHGSRGISGEA
jgi:hypothetical protein